MSKRKKESRTAKAVVVVESPAKARTINRYLGSDYTVKASLGHVRDLPKNRFGIDLTDNFRPTYEIVRGRARVLAELKQATSKASEVYLATDRDREGEAIAWHLTEALNLPPEKVRRVVFNEITRSAIAEAFAHPHQIDMDRVNAQQARRILDRIVGYELSPLLWKKVAKGLSAGRVQSVAVRLIVDREREIRAFVPQESWKIVASVTPRTAAAGELAEAWRQFLASEPAQKEIQNWLTDREAFRVELAEVAGEPFRVTDADAAARIATALGYQIERIDRRAWEEYRQHGLEHVELVGRFDHTRAPALRVSELRTKRTSSRPPAPFTTATLQQQASTILRFSNARTMRIAQALYEGIDIKGEGPVGLITYMRTDSTNLAGEAVAAARDLIRERYGARYLPEKPNVFGKRQARAQEAHEAIRPTDPRRVPEAVREALTEEQYKLYELIWRRFVACQMAPAEWDLTNVSLTCQTELGPMRFAGVGRKLVFEGFLKVAGVKSEDQLLPALEQGAALAAFALEPRQQFSTPPPRYTEASLVRALESAGIGRPSTYATIVETIQERGYVEQIDRKFYPTPLGELVTDKLVKHFPQLMDVQFTSHMEDELDKIEEAHLDWVQVLREFYEPFREQLDRAGDQMEATRGRPSEHRCPQCDAPMVYRWSKAGQFLSCSRYPQCKATLKVNREGEPVQPSASDQRCEACGRPMVLRQSRTGFFLGCSGYPECRHTIPCDQNGRPLPMVSEAELSRPCEACGQGALVVKWKGRRAFLGCNRYPECKNVAPLPEGVQVRKKPAPPPQEAGLLCEKCQRPMVIRSGRRGRFVACSGYPKCRNTKPLEKLEELRAAARNAEQANAGDAEQSQGSPPGTAGSKPGEANADNAPPPGFALTRNGRLVVETLPGDGELTCPECGGKMELKRGRFGPFFSCRGYPNCRRVVNLRGEAKKQAEELLPRPERPRPVPTDIPCQKCGALMVVRHGPRGRFLGCSRYPACRSTQPLPEELAATLADNNG